MSKSRRVNKEESVMTTVARATKRTVQLSEQNRKERKLGAVMVKRMWNEELIGVAIQ